MIALDNGDKIRGDASAATVVDYTLHGLVGTVVTQLADGQLAAAIGDLYTAGAAGIAVTSIVLVNTDTSARTVNLYLTPSGGTARRLIPKDMSLGISHMLVFDGQKIQVLDASGQILYSITSTAHAILDGSVHNDSVADAVTRGSVIYGNATPKWDELILGAAGEVLKSDGTDAAWGHGKTIQDADGDTKIQVEESADEDIVRMDTAGVEAFHLSAIGMLTLAKQSRGRAHRNADFYVPSSPWCRVPLDDENYDNQDELDTTSKIGTADATEANKLHDADGGFASGDVGKWVYNTTDHTYTTVSAFVDSGELTLTDDIMADTEGYEVYASTFTATEDGYYAVSAMGRCNQTVADKYYFTGVFKNGAHAVGGGWQAAVGDGAATNAIAGVVTDVMYLAANDVLDLRVAHNEGDDALFDGEAVGSYTFMAVHKLS